MNLLNKKTINIHNTKYPSWNQVSSNTTELKLLETVHTTLIRMFHVMCFAASEHWTQIPLLVKIYKLLINELSNQIESSMSTQGTLGDENDEVKNGISLFIFW